MKINIETCPLSKMRYPTAGDYWKDKKGVWQFRILEMHNPLHEVLILIHELVEWSMCLVCGISFESIDSFDIQFEKDRSAGINSSDAEPGDHPLAPYHHQHQCATRVEKFVCRIFGIDWGVYSKVVNNG